MQPQGPEPPGTRSTTKAFGLRHFLRVPSWPWWLAVSQTDPLPPPPRLPVCTPVVSMEVPQYQEASMATDTLTKPVIAGGTTTTKVFKNFIDGEWVGSTSGQTFEDRNPADTREVVAIFQRSNKDDVDAAVDAAKLAFANWRLVPAPRRANARLAASTAASTSSLFDRWKMAT